MGVVRGPVCGRVLAVIDLPEILTVNRSGRIRRWFIRMIMAGLGVSWYDCRGEELECLESVCHGIREPSNVTRYVRMDKD